MMRVRFPCAVPHRPGSGEGWVAGAGPRVGGGKSVPMNWFGTTHWMGVLAVVGSCLLVGRAPQAWRQWLDRALLINLWVYVIVAYAARWASLSLATCLPLHLCDFILMGAIWLLSRPHRRQWLYDCLFLWSWIGSVWALITPDLPFDFPHYRYFEFFWGHGLIFVVLAHLAGGHGYGLQPDSWKRAAWGLQAWILGVGGLDYAFGWNYGYLMSRPPAGSPLDLLGPWPLYIVVADLGAVLAFWGMSRVWGRRLASGATREWVSPS